MGVQYGMHLLKDLPKRDCNLASRTSLANNHAILDRIDNNSAAPGTHKCEDWMDGPLEEPSKEYLRNTMLHQEKVFNEQVLELHRLYCVQRALMSELNKELGSRPATAAAASSGAASDAKSGLWSSTSDSKTSLSSSRLVDRTCDSAQMSRCYRVNMENRRVLVPTSMVQDRPHCKYEEGRHTDVAEKAEDNDLDLTLRIGSTCNRVKASKVEPAESTSSDAWRAIPLASNHGMPWKEEQHAHAGHVISFHNPGAGAGLQMQSPPWLLHGLSLNRA